MKKTLTEIAKIVEGEVIGDGNTIITGLSGLQEAKEGDLAFVASSKYIPLLKTTNASAIIVGRDIKALDKPVICTNNPSMAFTKIASFVTGKNAYSEKGIHKTAIISEKAKLGKNVNIGPYTVIADDVTIGNDTTICGGCNVSYQVSIGKGCFLCPNVTLLDRVIIGDNVVIHGGTVIGSDGFGYEMREGKHQKVPQLGIVVIEDDVEIGANVTIDRARFDKTIIGRGTKIDNLVQVAHNVVIGENCLIVSQTGVSGSVTIGKGSILAGQSGVAGHLTLGEGVIVAAKSVVTKSIPSGETVMGFPAKPQKHFKRVNACMQNLPNYVKEIRDLKKRIEELERKSGNETKNG